MTGSSDRAEGRRVPSIQQLRPVAQGVKTRADRRWSYRLFRHLSIYLTWALLHTPITPNQVTALSLVIAGAGLVLIGASTPAVAIVGCLLLLLYHLLDRVDGEIARYREVYSLHGIYLDNAGHYLTGAGLLIAASYRLAPLSADSQILWLAGSIGALAAVLTRVEKHAAFHLFGQYVLERPELVEGMRPSGGFLTRATTEAGRSEDHAKTGAEGGIAAAARDVILTSTSFPVTTGLLLVAFVAEAAAGSPSVSVAVLYGVVALQVVGYAGIEFANLTQNLGAESARLARLADLLPEDSEE